MARVSPREVPKIVGRYEIVRQLGVGAMGRVLLGRDPVLERHVAIKILREDLMIGSDVRDALLVRMRHEARAAARVTHPHLVVIHDMGEDDDLGLYLVFEYIEGPTLKQRLGEGRLSARQAARIGKEIGAALTHAHDKGVLHRDVKPENIILSPTGTKLTDFGIARVPDSTLTHTGGLLGTPAYSAPETFRDGNFSPESDQFSLAATLYEAISGARAFPGEDAVSVASRIANEAPEAFAEGLRYPAELDRILLRGMAKAPGDRFESCKVLGVSVVEALVLSGATAKRSEDTTERSGESMLPRLSASPDAPSDPPQPDRRSLHLLLGGLGLLICVGVVVRLLVNSSAETPQALAAAPTTPSATPTASAVESTAAPAPTPRPPRRKPDMRPTAESASVVGSSAAPSASTSANPSASSGASAKAPPSASAKP